MGLEAVEVQRGGEVLRKLRSADHRPAYGVWAVRRKAPRQIPSERTELVGMVEERAELEPRSGVVAGLHLEMAPASRDELRDPIRYRASMRGRG